MLIKRQILAMKTHLLMAMLIMKIIMLVRSTQGAPHTEDVTFWRKENKSQLLIDLYRIRHLKNVLKHRFKEAKKTNTLDHSRESLQKLTEGEKDKKVYISPILKEKTLNVEKNWFVRIN